MVKKIHPKWGWELTHNQPDYNRRLHNVWRRRPLDRLEIIDHPEIEYLNMYFDMALWHFYMAKFDDQPPTPSQKTEAIAETRDAFLAFEKCVSQLDYYSRISLGQAFERASGKFQDEETAIEFCALFFDQRKKLSAWKEALLLAMDHLDVEADPPRRGRKPDTALRTFILELADFYNEFTGVDAYAGFTFDAIRDSYSSPFFDFIWNILDAFAPDLNITQHALAAHIQRALGKKASG